MKRKQRGLRCFWCGEKLQDAGCYKVECPNGCLEPMEYGYMKDHLQELKENA